MEDLAGNNATPIDGDAMGPVARHATVAAATVLAVVSLGMLGWQRLTAPAIASSGSATLAGLTVELGSAEWVELGHVHDGQGGFLMPDQMMPGAPQGDQVRLGIRITLSNTDSGTREFSLVDEFAVVGGAETEPRRLSTDSIGLLSRLGAGAAVHGRLYFDIEVPGENDPPLYLRWTRDGDTIQIPVSIGTNAPEHDHG
jgi:hypothetical protein